MISTIQSEVIAGPFKLSEWLDLSGGSALIQMPGSGSDLGDFGANTRYFYLLIESGNTMEDRSIKKQSPPVKSRSTFDTLAFFVLKSYNRWNYSSKFSIPYIPLSEIPIESNMRPMVPMDLASGNFTFDFSFEE